MSFLDWSVESEQAPRKAYVRRRRLAEALIARFVLLFPQIIYTLNWDSRLINAQAWRLGEQRNVYLYGGLVRHRAISRAGLALALAHETGHHLGGEPYDPVMTWMTSEKQSDHWAVVSCMPRLFGSKASSLTLRGAQEIAALHRGARGGSGAHRDDTEENERFVRFLPDVGRLRAALEGSTWEH